MDAGFVRIGWRTVAETEGAEHGRVNALLGVSSGSGARAGNSKGTSRETPAGKDGSSVEGRREGREAWTSSQLRAEIGGAVFWT